MPTPPAGVLGEGGAPQFVEYRHRGRLEVTATSETTATFELLDEYRKLGSIGEPASTRYDATVTASDVELTFAPRACAMHPAPAKARFRADTVDAKSVVSLELPLPYGTNAIARYGFTEE